PVYFESIFSFTPSQANSLGNWWWLANAITLVVVGVVSDRLRVRKPFMILGAAGAIAMTIVYLGLATAPHTGYYTLAWVVAVLAIFLAIAFAPWMASFTETVERRNPALTAHGLAVWGWVLRATVAISVFILPYVVSSTTAVVRYATLGKRALAIQKADPTIKIVLAHQALFTQLNKYPASKIPASLLAKAVKEVGLKNLLTVAHDPRIPHEIAFFQTHASQLHQVLAASAAAPSEWQHWWWVCVGGEVLFIPLVLFMAGRWSPRRARLDEIEHNARVEEELARLQLESGGAQGVAP
ncbi:MAG: MFS transporter, partial [Solirubrobacteraceae bacterium]